MAVPTYSMFNSQNRLSWLVQPFKWIWLYHQPRADARKHAVVWRSLILAWRVVIVLALIDAAYVWSIWPNFDKLRTGPIPKSRFIQTYEQDAREDEDLPKLQWQRVNSTAIPRHVKRAAVVGEDAHFYSHFGIDTEAIVDAMDRNLSAKRWKYGASTISQQTVKNLFFSPKRSLFRKWHEMLLTFGMESKLSKDRILVIYLNIAEFGEGIYGIEAAAQHYFGVPASSLNERQAAELIATLPAPKKDNPNTRTTMFNHRANAIYRWIRPTPEQPTPDEQDIFDLFDSGVTTAQPKSNGGSVYDRKPGHPAHFS